MIRPRNPKSPIFTALKAVVTIHASYALIMKPSWTLRSKYANSQKRRMPKPVEKEESVMVMAKINRLKITLMAPQRGFD